MKKKKEFFRIRKDRKRKNGANARTYVRIQPATVCRFSDKREENAAKAVDCFFIPTLVLFSKPNRPSLVF